MRALIIDGYVDEPACFGVPPYISPYVRYCAGVFRSRGWDVLYATCDLWRQDRGEWDEAVASADVVTAIMGMTVPGRYRGGSPLTMREFAEISSIPRRGHLVLGGPVHSGYTLRGGTRARNIEKIRPDGVDAVSLGDPEAMLEKFFETGDWHESAARNYELIDRIAPLGAEVARQHPSFPNVIAEMELSRGCDRADGHCSYCAEGFGAPYEERTAEGICAEISALGAAGVEAFRLGRCSNILAWGGTPVDLGVRPNAARIEELYRSIRLAVPNIRVLHTDNCNPATVARFPDESASCVEAIARHNTEGDGLSLGIESLDPAVKKLNNLKVDIDEALLAVRVINEAGGRRKNPHSLPSLLPGLNFLFGLAGETKETLEWNDKFLRVLLEDGLAVRRINIRRAIVFDGAPLTSSLEKNPPRIKERDYRRWKNRVREEVDPIMLGRVAPDGTIIRKVILEERSGKVLFGRPLGSYPPLVGVVSETLSPGGETDAAVTGRGGRSLTAVRYPLDIGTCSRAEFEALPGIGRPRAERLISMRPYRDADDIKKSLEALDAPGISEKLFLYFEGYRPDQS